MATLQHPFRRLQVVKRESQGLPDILIASASRYLYSYNATTGQRLDSWPRDVTSATAAPSTTDDQVRPEKRVKLSPSAEGQQENKSSNNKAPGSIHASIPLMEISSDGKYVITSFSEDKSIRVFELSAEGKLSELSSRVMPKKASALTLTPDDQNIIIADKFGDAYSLPVIPGEWVKKAEAKPFVPAATELTVHTRGNLRTLEMQKLQAEKASNSLKDETKFNFEHHSIIGHVSVLTDVIAVSLSGRSYILTADRDEHIRVSRGIPQAHVIEQYCLGHTSVISKICVPSWAPNLLVSGDAEGNLLLWDWQQAQILQHTSLQQTLQSEVMIRGIWAFSFDQMNVIVVSLDGSSQLLCYTINENSLQAQDTIQLSGNILDLAPINSHGSIVASVDVLHESGSTDSWKSSSGVPLESFQLTLSDNGIKASLVEDSVVTNVNLTGTTDIPADINEKQKKELDDSLYNLENMKKKTFDD